MSKFTDCFQKKVSVLSATYKGVANEKNLESKCSYHCFKFLLLPCDFFPVNIIKTTI